MIGSQAGTARLGLDRDPLAFWLVLWLLSVPAAAQEEFVLTGEVHLEGQGRLRGQRALVSLRGAHDPFFRRSWSSLGGRFKFNGLPAGVYVLSAQLPGLAESRVSVDVSGSLADPKGEIHRVIVLDRSSTGDAGQVSIAELSIPQAAWKAYSRAEKLLAKGEIDQALRQLKKAIKRESRFPAAHNMLGTVYYQRQDYLQAEAHFRKALKADSHAYAPLVNLGGVLISLGRFEEAVEVNSQARRKRPDDPLANSQLGLSYWRLGQADEAIEYLTQAKQLDPGHFSYPQLTLAQVFLALGEPEKAEQEMREFLKLHPDSAQASRVRRMLNRLGVARRRP